MRLRLVSANIRKSDADDGANAWPQRRAFCAALLAAQDADCFGLQESRHDQLEDLRAALPEHDWHALPRSPDRPLPINAIAWRRGRFCCLGAGGFWLSEQPHRPGAPAWGSGSIRLCNWVLLEERNTGRQLRYANTHLDHISQEARWQACRLIAEEAAAWPETLPQLLSADANARIDAPELVPLAKGGWRDAWREAGAEEPPFTFHDFTGHRHHDDTRGRIDHWWLRGPVQAQAARCLDDCDPLSGRWPSDHYFMRLEVTLAGAG
jgi:endonuclease/exonuclease/phosphatase family metal-dependent hydrolase